MFFAFNKIVAIYHHRQPRFTAARRTPRRRWGIIGNHSQMKLPRVYPILDSDTLARFDIPLTTAASSFLEGGAVILQIRHKHHWSRGFYETAKTVARLCREAGAQLIVNDRADFALLLDAGLHIGQDDLTPRDARTLLGTAATIGYSSHHASQIAAAGGEPVDYVALGPIFETTSKANPDTVVGLDELKRLRPLLEKPLVAIGGITLANACEVLRAGANSLALIAGLIPESPTAQSLRQRMEQWQQLVITA